MNRIKEIDEEGIHLVEALPFLVGADDMMSEENARRLLRRVASGSSWSWDPTETSARSFLSRL